MKTRIPNCLSVPSRWRRMFCSLFFAAAAIAVFAAIGSSRAIGRGGPLSRTATADKIAPWVVEHTANGQQAEFMVVLADQADLSAAATMRTKTEKGRFVHDTLWSKSQTTQGPILRWLRERGLEHRSFYIVNAILVKGTRDVAETLAARPDVAQIEGNPRVQMFPHPFPVVAARSEPSFPETVEPGINYTHAPDVWALGYTGQGIVVGSLDSGVRWTHNALKPHYRGWDGVNADHDYNWHDAIHDSVGNPCGNDSPEPCDDLGHGSHTTGIAVGDDGAGNQIGMAPDAKWIGCRSLDQFNSGTMAATVECMEFFLAPYPVGGDPSQGDPSKAPDITNNSWNFLPPCPDCYILRAAVEAQHRAGIMMVTIAGNLGPGCSSLSLSSPGIYEAAYTVGALITGTDIISSFSSRGPVDGNDLIKPDITAPGTFNRSAFNTSDDAYVYTSGTSMAAPHIAGAMALLWSAHPELKNEIDPSRAVLNDTAVHIGSTRCGDAGPPNNVYGWGRVDVFAAVTGITPTPTPTPTATPCGFPSWVERAPMPFKGAGTFATSDGTFVYAGGGLDENFAVRNDLVRYDPVADSWTSLAPSSDYYFGGPAVYFQGKIYDVGGFDATFQPTNTTRIYDIRSNTWSTGAPMPAALGGIAALWNGIIYVAGGATDAFGTNVVNTLYAYDIAANSWTTLASMPQALWVQGFGAIHGKLYVAGGSDGVTPLNTLYIYDIRSNTWTTGANLPAAAGAAGSAVLHNRLYLFGGLPTAILTQIYDPVSNTWSFGPDLAIDRWRFYATAVGNHSIVILGGQNAAGGTLDDNDQLRARRCVTEASLNTAGAP